MIWAVAFYWILGLYAFIGAMFGLYFVWRGAARIDDGAGAMPVTVRLIILPGSIALWPLLLTRLILAAKAEP